LPERFDCYREGRLEVLAIDGLHEVTKLATIDDENKALATLRHHRTPKRRE
jgi:hypothetical protein